MSTIISEAELRKKAIAHISAKLEEGRALSSLIDETGQRYNLGPKDTDFLIRFFQQHNPKDK